MSFLSVTDLRVAFRTRDGLVRAVDGLSFDVDRGRTLGIVGESGSGKSAACQAILGLYRGPHTVVDGEVWLDGRELTTLSEGEISELRGREMAMIFQDALSSLHPFYPVGWQISEAYRVHNRVRKREAKQRAIELLDRVGIPGPHRRYADYPHRLSGGMRQRAMIAMALVCNPGLLIADEPTTALDVTVQAQILDLIKDLQDEFDIAVILVSHDLGVVAEVCDTVMVMYGGQCVERGPVGEVFARPEMPYTWGLLGSMPRLDRARQGRLTAIIGQPPSLLDASGGCVFQPRCQFTEHVQGTRCGRERPELLASTAAHEVRCHLDVATRRRIFTMDIAPAL